MATWKPDPQTYDQALHEIGCLEQQVADLQEQLAEALRDEFHDLRKRAETSWQRGFQHGLESNRQLATHATDALKQEREAHAETNRAMTDALLMMEEREQRDEALLRQALEALELRCGTNADERKELIHALRERLGEKA